MYLIVGLGNPGQKYEHTKHNMGFDVVEELIERHRIGYSGTDMKAMYGKGMINGEKVIVIKPMTYMNLSGEAVQQFLHYYKIDPESEMLVIYDDIDLEPGQLRIRKKGSAGGHNGMKNIISCIGTDQFPRVRVGVGAKPQGWDLADYVLAPFGREERKLVDAAIKDAADAAELIIGGEIDKAMNRFNRKIEREV